MTVRGQDRVLRGAFSYRCVIKPANAPDGPLGVLISSSEVRRICSGGPDHLDAYQAAGRTSHDGAGPAPAAHRVAASVMGSPVRQEHWTTSVVVAVVI